MQCEKTCTVFIETVSKEQYEVDIDIEVPSHRYIDNIDVYKYIKETGYIKVSDKCVMSDKIESFMII